jgi:hypothetical protein
MLDPTPVIRRFALLLCRTGMSLTEPNLEKHSTPPKKHKNPSSIKVETIQY